MSTKHILSLLVILFCRTAHAQDKIYMYNREVIQAKVKNVSPEVVTYKRWDNQDGPDYTAQTNDVIKIMYSNGSQDIMNEKLARRLTDNNPRSKEYDKLMKMRNIVYVAPIQFTENGFGFSLSYERILDKNDLFRFYLPVMATFNVANNTYRDSTGNTVVRTDPMFYVMPGIKVRVYEPQENRAVYLGTSIVFADGRKTSGGTSYYGYYGNSPIKEQNKLLFGMIAHASVEVCPTPRIYLSAEFGAGWTYSYSLAGIPQNNSGLVELGFKIGYRY